MPDSGKGVIGTIHPGKGALLPNGKRALYDPDGGACECCPVCPGPPRPDSFLENFSPISPLFHANASAINSASFSWNVIGEFSAQVSGTATQQGQGEIGLSYVPQVNRMSSVSAPSINKQRERVDFVRIKFKSIIPFDGSGSGLVQSFASQALYFSPRGYFSQIIPYQVSAAKSFGDLESWVGGWVGTGASRVAVPFHTISIVENDTVELIHQRLSLTTSEARIYVNGALQWQTAASVSAMPIPQDVYCDVWCAADITLLARAGTIIETMLDDLFFEIGSSNPGEVDFLQAYP